MHKFKETVFRKIVTELLHNDPFSLNMGIKIIDAHQGYCKCSLNVKPDMLNGFGITHGGVIFSLADTTLAFTAATFGNTALALEHSISFLRKSNAGNIITAEGTCLHMGKKTGTIRVDTYDSNQVLIATSKGTIFKTGHII